MVGESVKGHEGPTVILAMAVYLGMLDVLTLQSVLTGGTHR